MDVVLGANGHVGTAVAQALLARGRAVTVALHSPAQAPAWEQRGAAVAIVDVCNTPALTALLGQASRAFVLNPPAPPPHWIRTRWNAPAPTPLWRPCKR
ncbi:NAD(P)H-binding protein [Acetobacter lambici]|uniref:NAD(P)H-binding protein n=1 Tax=Acetobacter lambici TaxID=1332824 RepID=A0ABT1F4F0_9PROT|nr:NAD(P)H-binding protein [Acetobacter lambici]MCP1244029.1 NAD(P)H-binding protein [Acetobacter lambici]MCP1260072.1 NAD(P)H-binding protein [Acetobacter lambici]